MIDTVGSLGYAKKLGKYGFSDRLCSNKMQCEEWLSFCEKNDMVWLKESYGTLVHKDFDKHFIRLNSLTDEITHAEIKLGIIDEQYKQLVGLNHSNVLKSRINNVYIVTSSPNYINFDNIDKYSHSVFIIHPSLLEDYSLGGINIGFTNATFEEIADINEKIYEDIGIYKAFRGLY